MTKVKVDSKRPRLDSRGLVWGLTFGHIRRRAEETLGRKLTHEELDRAGEHFSNQMNELDGGWPEIIDGCFFDLKIEAKEGYIG